MANIPAIPSIALHAGDAAVAGSSEITSPTQIANLAEWHNAQRSAWSALPDGTAVLTWDDDSGAGRHLTQATGSKQPLRMLAGINGRPALRFDGVDDELLAGGTALNDSAYTVLAAVRETRAIGTGAFSDRMFRMGGGAILASSGELGFYAVNNGGAATVHFSSGEALRTAPRVIAVTQDASAVIGRVNGVPDPDVFPPFSQIGNFNLVVPSDIGAFYSKLDVGEILIYSRVLSSIELGKAERYLSRAWGISLP